MAAVAILMAVWWITEAIPIPATALLPVALFPLLGIAAGKQTASHYFNSIIFLFLGGFLFAIVLITLWTYLMAGPLLGIDPSVLPDWAQPASSR